MPNSLFVEPEKVRKKGVLEMRGIELNAYDKTLKDVKDDFSKEDLMSFLFDMQLNREFETMLQGTRTVKSYNGVDYAYTGPAHLSIGQEAVAAGQAYALGVEDFSFATHRSHGEVLARGMWAIRRYSDDELYGIMKSFKDGAILKNVESFSKNKGNVKELAIDFFLYGFMSEIFGREIGFTGGLGNSMHVFFEPFGIYPNNALVGGSCGIGAGAALYKKLSKSQGIVVVTGGDGSLSTGHAWEAINFASMAQYNTLWDEEYRGGLPVMFNFINNFYAMSGQPIGETTGFDVLARVGAAFSESQLHTERVDGYNIFAVIDAYKRKKQLLLDKQGPVFMETITYRHAGHATTDQNAYRTKEEMDLWMETQDSIACFRKGLEDEGIASADDMDAMKEEIKNRVTEIMIKATDLDLSPRMDFFKDPDAIAKFMFSNEYDTSLSEGKPEVIGEKADNSRARQIARKFRTAADENGEPYSALKTFSYRDAIFEALLDKFYTDPTMILFGEDVREHGNSFGVLRGLYESVPRHRMFNTPIAEASIIAAAVGYALCGGRAVPEIMWCDFLGRCADELFNQLSKWQGMSAGVLKMPVVVRVSIGAFYGAQHSQDWSSLATHIPGLKIVYPASPYDAKGLLNYSLNLSDPVIFFESQKLYDMGERFRKDGVPEEYYEVPVGECDVKLEGSDITLLTIGPALYQALLAAEELKERWGIGAEIIDARTLVPFDYHTVIRSVEKTGRIVIVSDACERGSYARTLASNITELAYDSLKAPPVVVGSHNWVSPCPELERFFFPNKDKILDFINEKIIKLEGYTPVYDVTNAEKLRTESLGV